ncbi:6631_t:CDS:1, partial [Acaulospora morrowiae]
LAKLSPLSLAKINETPRTGKEADTSWLPVSKPRLNGADVTQAMY